jgi:hypothetical protein
MIATRSPVCWFQNSLSISSGPAPRGCSINLRRHFVAESGMLKPRCDRTLGCSDETLSHGDELIGQSLVEWSGGATGLDQWLPSYQPFRASWRTALGSCRRFLHPLYSWRAAGFSQYGWKPALSSCALPIPVRPAFDAGPAVHAFLASPQPFLAEARLGPASMSMFEGCT